MRAALSLPSAPLDAALGGVLLANMLEGWLASESSFSVTVEATDELEDHRTAPEQTGLYICAPVNDRPSAPPSGEHGAPVCAAPEGPGTGLERSRDPHPRSGPGGIGCPDGGAAGLQDLGGGCLDGPSGRCLCLGSLAAGALEPRLASAAGVVRAHRNTRGRRRWLLRFGGLQRWTAPGTQRDDGPGRVAFFARPPPRRQAQ